ncbi:hypothetical protein [Paludisphaera rhizosphaerae]|uniref:hypothetical protein n=1 Tax=Paludisphaera rhizosphaerae TaxID=2711216 RepID=UPI0013EA3F55|nr:hypothetical protein [Paludisphaera rhizosphaerae]
MEQKTVEGTWEQVATHAREFAGRRVRVTVLDELAAPADQALQEKLAEEAFKQHLLTSGLVTRFPSALDAGEDEDDAPIAVSGEPVSESLLRERR